MSERLRSSHEHQHHSPEKHHETSEKAHEKAHHKHKENLAQIRETAAEQAMTAEQVTARTEHTAHAPREAFVNKELKDLAYTRTLKRIRQNMSKPAQAFSKVVHQPVVDAVSEGLAKTVGRPSGILGGGILALAGTSAYYYITKHYGYDYNFMIFLILLAGGFVAGWLVEFLVRAMRGSR